METINFALKFYIVRISQVIFYAYVDAFADNTALFLGLKYINDFLMENGPTGSVHAEMLLKKNSQTFTFKQGWSFPRMVYLNGDYFIMPPPDTYPTLPNSVSVL